MRFRQSYAKLLLSECPALCKKAMGGDQRASTRAMDRGSLLDYLVFDRDDQYEVIDAVYETGDRAGEQCTDWTAKQAKEARADCLERGVLAVLSCEVDDLAPTADAIREKIRAVAAQWAGGEPFGLHCQQKVLWTSDDGIDCHGTPDVIVTIPGREMWRCLTIDVKHTAALQPAKFRRQVADMYWDVQGVAYREAAVQFTREQQLAEEGEVLPVHHIAHVIVATSSIELGLPPVARELDAAFMVGGVNRWVRAQRAFKVCLDSGAWPGYPDEPVSPDLYYVRKHIESFEETDIEEEP